jgi:hypothetical protein
MGFPSLIEGGLLSAGRRDEVKRRRPHRRVVGCGRVLTHDPAGSASSCDDLSHRGF